MQQRSAALGKSLRILDAGCGAGNVALPLASLGHHVVATDRNWTSLNYARNRNGFQNLDLVRSELETIPLEGPFDVIVILEVLEHLKDPRSVLGRLHALAAPDGLLLVSVPNGYGPSEAYGRIVDSVPQAWQPWEIAWRVKRSVQEALRKMNAGRKAPAPSATGASSRALSPAQEAQRHAMGGPDAFDSGPHVQKFTEPAIRHLLPESGWKVEGISHSDWISGIEDVSRLFRFRSWFYILDQQVADRLPTGWVSGWYLSCRRESVG